MGKSSKKNPNQQSSTSRAQVDNHEAESHQAESDQPSESVSASGSATAEHEAGCSASSSLSSLSLHGSEKANVGYDKDQAPFFQTIAVDALQKLKQYYIESIWWQDPEKDPNIQFKKALWEELLNTAQIQHPDPKHFYNSLLTKIRDVQDRNKEQMRHRGNGKGNFDVFCVIAKELIESLISLQDADACQQWLSNHFAQSFKDRPEILNNLKHYAGDFFGLGASTIEQLKEDKAAYSIASLMQYYWFNKEMQDSLSRLHYGFSESFRNKLNRLLGDGDIKQPQKLELVFERISYLLEAKQANEDKSSDYYAQQVIGALDSAKNRNDEIECRDSSHWQTAFQLTRRAVGTFFPSHLSHEPLSLANVIDQIKDQLDTSCNKTYSM